MNGSRISFSGWCRQKGYETLLRQWDDEANQFRPEDIGPCSRRTCWWRCEKTPEHRWAEPSERRTHHKSQECAFCSGRFLIGPVNSLVAKYPKIAKEFDVEKNGVSPETIFPKRNRRYWWRCSRGHSWQATPNSRTSERGCPYCRHRLASPEYNLATEFPLVAEEWLYEKTTVFPPIIFRTQKKKPTGAADIIPIWNGNQKYAAELHPASATALSARKNEGLLSRNR